MNLNPKLEDDSCRPGIKKDSGVRKLSEKQEGLRMLGNTRSSQAATHVHHSAMPSLPPSWLPLPSCFCS